MRNGSSKRTWRLATAVFVALLITSGSQMAFAPQGPAETNFFRGPARERAFAESTRLREIKRRYRGQITAQPGVHGMGIGLDRQTGRLIFDVAVDPGVPEPALPRTIEGVPVRILRLPRAQAIHGGSGCKPCHADLLPLPVQMGNSAHTEAVSASGGGCFAGACTLGFKACDLDTGLVVYVTNAHCSTSTTSECAGSAGAGAQTYHRAPLDANSCTPENVVGTTAKERPPICGALNTVDAASVNSNETLTQLYIRDIGFPSPYPGSVLPGDLVQKSGRTTGHTFGEVDDIAWDPTSIDPSYCPCGVADFVDQIKIVPSVPGTEWAIFGDSGSAVLDTGETPAIVGLNFSAAQDPVTGAWLYGIANPIAEVVAQLDLSLNVFDCQLQCAATLAAPGTQGSSERRSTLGTIRNFRDYVLARSERGRDYIRLYYRFTGDTVKLMLTHPRLLGQTSTLLGYTLPVLEAVTAGRGVTVTPEQIAAVDTLFARYAEVSSDPELQKALTQLRGDLHDPEVLQEFGVRVH